MPTLIELNALRTAANMKPLKAWKESKDKLAAAIKKLSGKDSTATVTKVPTGMTAAKAAKAKEVKPAKAPKIAKEKVAKETKKIEGTPLSTIAEELGIDAKVARAKLRRAFADADGTGSKEGRWVFKTDKEVAEVKAILKGDARKKEA